MTTIQKSCGIACLNMFFLFVCCATVIRADDSRPLTIQNSGFENEQATLPTHWETWTPRASPAPEFGLDQAVHHTGTASARIRCGDSGQLGIWRQRCANVVGGSSYQFTGYFRTEKIDSVHESIWANLEWRDAAGEPVAKDYAIHFEVEKDGWFRIDDSFNAPAEAVAVGIEVGMQFCQGTVWWDDLDLKPCQSTPVRKVRVSTGFVMPKSLNDPEKHLAFFAEAVDQAGRAGSDIVCLGETINYVRSERQVDEVAESIPGPSTEALGKAARRNKIWIVAGLYEREKNAIYNTAVLIDREGHIAGRYRKTHLPETEVIAGVVPGTEYPVFKTDFGTIGLQVCWDNFFPEVARSLALNGAEIIFTPIWGDGRDKGKNWDIIARARAIDNAVHFVAATYNTDNHSLIVDPWGHVLADTGGKEGLVTADLELGVHKRERWLSVSSSGEWKQIYVKARRPTTYGAMGVRSRECQGGNPSGN